jgi:hypothetical protein
VQHPCSVLSSTSMRKILWLTLLLAGCGSSHKHISEPQVACPVARVPATKPGPSGRLVGNVPAAECVLPEGKPGG